MKKWVVLIALTLSIAGGAAYLGLGGVFGRARTPVAPPVALTLFYTCDTRGHINPCNCEAGVAGGLARRATFVNQRRTPLSLLVDAGDVTSGPREWELLELDYLLKGYGILKYDAVNVGAREASIALTELKKIAATYPFLVSANIHDGSGTLVFPPYRVVDLPEGFRVGILGALDEKTPADELGAGVRVLPMRDAITRYLPKLRKQVDFVVLLAFTDEQTLRALAEEFFEIDVIVGGKVEQPSGTPLEVNRSTIAYITDKGKSVGELELSFVGGQKVVTKNEVTMLMEDVKDDPAIADLIKELTNEQVKRNYPTEKDDEEGLSTIAPAA
ncbi:MAG: hypothetical protein K1Y02_04580 [Candidatus Hydrogenedentes bacterium]|nr:hypothetical protein [Candidatus Hydrogenedentota bacterium]